MTSNRPSGVISDTSILILKNLTNDSPISRCVSFWLALNVFLALNLFPVSRAAAIEPDFLMDSDPELPIPAPVLTARRDFQRVWTEALESPSIDMQRMAAESIAHG